MKSIGSNSPVGDELQREIRHCEKHGDYEADILSLGGIKRSHGVCPRCMQERSSQRAKAEASAIQAFRARQIAEDRINSGIPRRFAKRGFDNYRATTQGQQRALQVASTYAEQFEDRLTQGGGLVFCGRPGTGKTHLAAAIANVVIETGRTVLFTSVMKLLRRVKCTYGREATETESDAIKAFIRPELLIVDEVGVQFGSQAESLILFEVLNGRYESMRPTIVLSNLGENELSQYLGERVVDRMREGGGAIVPCTWESYRGAVHKDDALRPDPVAEVDWADRYRQSREF